MSSVDSHSMSVELPTAASIEKLHQKLDELLNRCPTKSAAKWEMFFERLLSGPEAFGLLQVYTAIEVAHMLGVERVQSIYEIPEDKLP